MLPPLQRLCAVAWTVIIMTLTVRCQEKLSPWSPSDCSESGNPQQHPVSYHNLRLLVLKNLRERGLSFWLIFRGETTHSSDWCGLKSGTLYLVTAQSATSDNFTFTPPGLQTPLHCNSEYLQLKPKSYGLISCAKKRHEAVKAVEKWWSTLPFAYWMELGVTLGAVVGVVIAVFVGVWLNRRRRYKGDADIVT